MHLLNFLFQKTHKVVIGTGVVVGLLTIGSFPFFSRDRVKNETIEASAMGTSTQLGEVVGVSERFMIFPPRRIVKSSFRPTKEGQNNGLVNALSKMRASHCPITDTLGYDISFIRMIPTPTGRTRTPPRLSADLRRRETPTRGR